MARNKFGAIPTTYKGIKYHSKKEAEYAKKLDLLVKAKKISSWTRQIPYPLVVNGKKIANYIMDFEVVTNDGTRQLIEVKGYETQVWKIKWKLIQALYTAPGIEFVLEK